MINKILSMQELDKKYGLLGITMDGSAAIRKLGRLPVLDAAQAGYIIVTTGAIAARMRMQCSKATSDCLDKMARAMAAGCSAEEAMTSIIEANIEIQLEAFLTDLFENGVIAPHESVIH